MSNPSNKVIIDRNFNWDLVAQRLRKFPHIGQVYKIDELRGCDNTPPYYCHYLGWRLGTWLDEGLFQYFDRLLETGMRLNGWNINRIPRDSEYGNYWSFVWELQVASIFSEITSLSELSWQETGPDLHWSNGRTNCYIECTVYRKSFSIEKYIEELLYTIHPLFRVSHLSCTRLSLTTTDLSVLFKSIFSPLIDNGNVERALHNSFDKSPSRLDIPGLPENFYVFVENPDAREIDPDQPWLFSGDPDEYLCVAVSEVLRAKEHSNKLSSLHPNLLVANFLLSSDFQLASSIRRITQIPIIESLDGVILSACGISNHKIFTNSYISLNSNHPLIELLRRS